MDNETTGIVISEKENQEFEPVQTTSKGPTSTTLKETVNAVGNFAAETTNRILEALKDFPEKLFVLIALIGFILVAFSGNMKEWKSFFIFVFFLILDIGFLIVFERYFDKNKQ